MIPMERKLRVNKHKTPLDNPSNYLKPEFTVDGTIEALKNGRLTKIDELPFVDPGPGHAYDTIAYLSLLKCVEDGDITALWDNVANKPLFIATIHYDKLMKNM